MSDITQHGTQTRLLDQPNLMLMSTNFNEKIEDKAGGSRERQDKTSYKLKMFQVTTKTQTGLTRTPY